MFLDFKTFTRNEENMGKYKSKRLYTVSSVFDREGDKAHPAIWISGDWLKDLGVETGKKIMIQCEGGRLTVELADEILQ